MKTTLSLLSLVALLVTSLASAATPLSKQDRALFAYAKCMRGKGVKIPDPVKGKDGKYAFPAIPASVTGAAGVREKAQACAASSGAGGARSASTTAAAGAAGAGQRPQLTAAQQKARQAALVKFQACMKKNGVTLPEGSLLGGGGRPGGTAAPGTRTGARPAPPAAGTGTTQRQRGAAPGAAGRGGLFGSADAKTQKALRACSSLLPAGPGGFGGPRGGGARQGAATGAAATTASAR